MRHANSRCLGLISTQKATHWGFTSSNELLGNMATKEMRTVLLIMMLAGVAFEVQSSAAQTSQSFDSKSATATADPDNGLPTLPPAPAGRTTIFGGAIQSVDPVRDQFELHIYGQRPMKILYDERTKLYRDGTKVPVLDLRSSNYASVQTLLDGANVFAVSIHILSHSPSGDCEGRVLSYNPGTRELLIASLESPEPVRLLVPANASVVRSGQATFTSASSGQADLVAGAIVSATFESVPGRLDTASRITVLAVPGSRFLFNGNVSFLDLHAGMLVLLDPRDKKSYEIHFNPANVADSNRLHIGGNVTVTAGYDGRQYAAQNIAIN